MLAGAAIFGSAASAQFDYSISPECRQEAVAECGTMWQAYGYRSYEDCAKYQPCFHCLAGYMCPIYDFTYAVKPDSAKPW
ncbi:MAG TPA: hypothetical protein VE891_08030 [Allosphingosinicella sp.]|nr:hypothetical protein [Allosphingosinicella sp.]